MKQAAKKLTFHPTYNHGFQKIFKKCNVTLAVQNKFNNKTVIRANHKEKTE